MEYLVLAGPPAEKKSVIQSKIQAVLAQVELQCEIVDEEGIASGGETYVIPPKTLHSVEALEDSVVMDLFSTPQR